MARRDLVHGPPGIACCVDMQATLLRAGRDRQRAGSPGELALSGLPPDAGLLEDGCRAAACGNDPDPVVPASGVR